MFGFLPSASAALLEVGYTAVISLCHTPGMEHVVTRSIQIVDSLNDSVPNAHYHKRIG